MKKWKVFLCFFFVSLCLFTSCRTTEYVPMKVDLTTVTDPVLMQRPDNSLFKIIENPKTVDDIVENSVTYLYGWTAWQAYADSLEKTLVAIRDDLKE